MREGEGEEEREREKSSELDHIPVPNPVVCSALHLPADCSHGQCNESCYDKSPAEAFDDRLDHATKPFFHDFPPEFIKIGNIKVML